MTLHAESPPPRTIMPTLDDLEFERAYILRRMWGVGEVPLNMKEVPELEARLCVVDALIISREAMAISPPLP